MFRTRHAAARSRHPLAPSRRRPASARRRRVDDAAAGGGPGRAGRTSRLRAPLERAGRKRAHRRCVRGRRAGIRRRCRRRGEREDRGFAGRCTRIPPHRAASPPAGSLLRRGVSPPLGVARGWCSTIDLSMALKTRVWSAGKLVLLAGALVAPYLIFAAAAMRIALRTREVQVPDFTNRTANEATAIAADFGLAMKIDESRRPDPKIPAGRVLAQEPTA